MAHSLKFEEDVYVHRPMVVHVCWKILGNQEDAEEAAQEAFFKASRALETFEQRNGATLQSWIAQIARHEAISMYRRRELSGGNVSGGFSKAPQVEVISLEEPVHTNVKGGAEEEQTVGDFIPAPEISPDRLILVQEMMEMVDQLCPEWREPLLMTMEGYSYQEIGVTMEMVPTAVRDRTCRVRKRIRKKLQQKA